VITAGQARRRYLWLLGLRWFPVGLTLPVGVLLPLDRGLSLVDVGVAASLQGLVVLALELPTGGLADAWGRRPVLLLAGAFAVVSSTLMLFAYSFAALACAYALQGAFRALDSGPLEAWFVDRILAADPEVRLDSALSGGSAMLSVGIAAGALTAAGLAALPVTGIEPLALPVLVAVLVAAAGLVAVAVLVVEPEQGRGTVGESLRDVPRFIADGVRLIRGSKVLAALVAVELFWGFGGVTFENLMPVRLAELVGGERPAAVLMGPVTTGGWVASAVGAAVIPLLSKRIGVAWSALLLRVLQGAAVIGMGLLAGVAGLLTGFLATYLVHGAANPLHMTLLHREVESRHRATVVSINSMAAQPAGSLGLVVLTSVAAGSSVGLAIVIGGVALALAAPLYLPALRAERSRRRAGERFEPAAAGP
jgi:hypothetical protein